MMEWSLVKLIATGHISFERGRITIVGERVAAVPIEFYIGLTNSYLNLQKYDKNAISKLYFIGWIAGYTYMVSFEKNYNVKSIQDRYRLGMDIASFAGVGDYKTIDWYPGEFSRFFIEDNPIGPKFYPSKNPVDHIIRGLQAGGGSVVHHKIIQCVELKCCAMVGGNRCEMMNAPVQVHEERGTIKKLRRQTNIDYVLPKQEKFIKNFKRFQKGEYNPWEES